MRGGAKEKDGEPATEENRSERQTWRIKGGGGAGGCFPLQASCLLLVSPLSIQSISHINKKTKQKKRKKESSTLPFLFKAKHAAGAHGTRLKMWHSHPYRIFRFIILLVVLATSKSSLIQHLIQWRCEVEVGQRGRKTCNCLKHTLSITCSSLALITIQLYCA